MQFCALIEELPRKAEFVGEGARRGATAEGIVVPLPHHRSETKKIRQDSLTSTPPIREGAKSAAIPSGSRGRACR
jgi:hypothetical protein